MARVQCKTCLGVYDEIQADGLAYFHACPPLPRVSLKLANGSIVIADHQVTLTEIDDGKGGKKLQRDFAPALPAGATYLADTFIERPNKRDENVAHDPATGKAQPKSEGAGKQPAP